MAEIIEIPYACWVCRHAGVDGMPCDQVNVCGHAKNSGKKRVERPPIRRIGERKGGT